MPHLMSNVHSLNTSRAPDSHHNMHIPINKRFADVTIDPNYYLPTIIYTCAYNMPVYVYLQSQDTVILSV